MASERDSDDSLEKGMIGSNLQDLPQSLERGSFLTQEGAGGSGDIYQLVQSTLTFISELSKGASNMDQRGLSEHW